MRARAEAKKQGVLTDLVTARQQILAVASTWPSDRQDEVFLGVWSVKDVLAHLIGWDVANLQAMRDILADQLPHFYAHHDRDWRTFNADLVQTYKQGDLAALLSGVSQSHQRLMTCLAGLPAEEFEKDRGLRFRGWKVTIARLLQAEADDERTHATQLKAFIETGR